MCVVRDQTQHLTCETVSLLRYISGSKTHGYQFHMEHSSELIFGTLKKAIHMWTFKLFPFTTDITKQEQPQEKGNSQTWVY